MAKALQDEIIEITSKEIITGPHIIDIISSGMYSEPMMILREFIQNASDSVDEAIDKGLLTNNQARIDIKVEGKSRTIKILDNGIGVSSRKVVKTLCSIAASEKMLDRGRGFRGIGRLGALGYCETLTFTTKTKDETQISKVIWDAKQLKRKLQENKKWTNLSQIVSNCITIISIPTDREKPSFFEVSMEGVKKFHNDSLMLIPAVRKYLSLHAPAPFSPSFGFRENVETHIDSFSQYKTYNIFLNDKQIYKPHSSIFKINSKKDDQITDIKLLTFFDKSREVELARGWYAISSFSSSIPKAILMRGITIRQGNILIGDGSYLANYFSEKRFSSWCIGEIHVSNKAIVNARRDGFEHTEELEALNEQFLLLGGHLSKIIKKSSELKSRKNTEALLQKKIDALGTFPIAIDDHHRKDLVKVIKKSNHKDRESIINNVKFVADVLDNEKPFFLTPLNIIEIIQKTLAKKDYDPILISEILGVLLLHLTKSQ